MNYFWGTIKNIMIGLWVLAALVLMWVGAVEGIRHPKFGGPALIVILAYVIGGIVRGPRG